MDHLYIALFGPGRGGHLPNPSDIESASKIHKISILIFDASLNYEVKSIPDYKKLPVTIIKSNKPRDMDEAFKIEDVDIRSSKKASMIPIVFVDYMGHKHVSEFMTYLSCGETFRRWYVLATDTVGSIDITNIVKEWSSMDTFSVFSQKTVSTPIIGAISSASSTAATITSSTPSVLSVSTVPSTEPSMMSFLLPEEETPSTTAVSTQAVAPSTESSADRPMMSFLLPEEEKKEEKKVMEKYLVTSYSYIEGEKMPDNLSPEEQKYIYNYYISVCRRISAYLRAEFLDKNMENIIYRAMNDTAWTMNLGTSTMMFFLKHWGLIPKGPEGETIDLDPIEEFLDNAQYRSAVTEGLIRVTANFVHKNNLLLLLTEEERKFYAKNLVDWYDQNTWGLILRLIERKMHIETTESRAEKKTAPRARTPIYREPISTASVVPISTSVKETTTGITSTPRIAAIPGIISTPRIPTIVTRA